MKQKMRILSAPPLKGEETKAGRYIDYSKPLTFHFAGREYQAYQGDVLASALMANGETLISRSFKYHRPRGVLTMAGNDGNTLVQRLVSKNAHHAEPNVLADTVLVQDGDRFDAQNYSGSLYHDKGRFTEWFSRFLPVGFYYKTFYRPVFGFFDRKKRDSWPLWEPLIRAQTGLGVLDLSVDAPSKKAEKKHQDQYKEKQFLHCDVAVVGSGPAGLAVALACACHALNVILIESERAIGGSLLYSAKAKLADKQKVDHAQQLIQQVLEHPNIKIVQASCSGVFEENFLSLVGHDRLYKLRAKKCVLATGELEQHVVFRNNDLPGIILCSAADRLLTLYGVKPGQRAVLLSASDEAYYSALLLNEHGVEVAAVIDLREKPSNSDLMTKLKNKNIALIQGSTVFQANANKDGLGLASVDVRKISAEGEVAKEAGIIDCDLLCISAGFMPSYHLACQAGAKLLYRDESHTFEIDNLPVSLYLAGSINGYREYDDVITDAENTAKRVCLSLSVSAQDLTEQEPIKMNPTQSVESWPIFKHEKGKEFVDFDEDLHIRDIENATRLGYRDIQLVKRFSTVGMGPSQGKHSALATARIVAKATARTVGQTGVTTARPPLVGESLSLLAGQCFDPFKRGALHKRHLELGAKMMPAGLWQRPAYYCSSEVQSEQAVCEAIQSEAIHVRKAVGIIDVSTLGGLDIRGPDAAEFLNRFYTFAFLKQKVGTTRYAIACNEYGVVIDDGVACRISENYFYVTATSSGVDALYRAMTRWNAQWRLNVDIANVTSAYSAVNVAGPDSRKLLEALDIDIDLSADAFPYLAYREGHCAGIPLRMLRVGFVGELGYEIHLPSAYAEALWDKIFSKAKEFNLRPIGIEAQRLLRLEKGHIIVGQDSDGMSHPKELGLSWAVSLKKPFFVGCKSVDIHSRAEAKRKLVGFVLDKSCTLPKEGHLVFANKKSAAVKGSLVKGHVTSVAYSPTLDKHIGLAFVGIEESETGCQFAIRVENNEVLVADVCSLPFYDPDNTRNKG